MTKRLSILFVGLMAVASFAYPENAPQQVFLESSEGTPTAKATVNDVLTVRFVIDTGAAEVSIPADVYRTLIRTGTVTADDTVGKRKIRLANGKVTELDRILLTSIKIGNYTVHSVPALVSPDSAVPLLGQSLLGRFRRVSIEKEIFPSISIEGPIADPVSLTRQPREDAGWSSGTIRRVQQLSDELVRHDSPDSDVRFEFARRTMRRPPTLATLNQSRDALISIAETAKWCRYYPASGETEGLSIARQASFFCMTIAAEELAVLHGCQGAISADIGNLDKKEFEQEADRVASTAYYKGEALISRAKALQELMQIDNRAAVSAFYEYMAWHSVGTRRRLNECGSGDYLALEAGPQAKQNNVGRGLIFRQLERLSSAR